MNAPLPAHVLPRIEPRRAPAALIEALRARFGERCSTALALREQHGRGESVYDAAPPEAVIFCESNDGVFLGTTAESDWLYTPDGAARTRPQAWRWLCTALDLQSGQLLLDVMQTRLHANQTAATTAALAWWRWEQDLMAAEAAGPDAAPPPDDHRALEMARIGVHYARARWFLPDSGLLAQTSRLHHLPCVIVQGGRDLVTPAAAARALHATWPGAQLHEVPQAGHASTQPDMAAALVQAIENADPNNPHHQEPRHGPLQAH